MKHSILNQTASRSKIEELCQTLSAVSSVVIFEVIGSGIVKPGTGLPGKFTVSFVC